MSECYTSSGVPIQIRVGKMCLGIPDDPTESSIQRILNFMQEGACIRWITLNRAEIERLRGTPGEPIPVKEAQIGTKIRWLDDSLDFETYTTSNSSMYEFTVLNPV